VFATLRDSDGYSSYDRLAAHLDDADDILDVACGAGTLLARLAARASRRYLAGVDLSLTDLQLAQASLPSGSFALARAQALPLPATSTDAVTCHLALMLMDDPSAVLREMRRVLRPGGRLRLVVINPFGSEPEVGRLIGALATAGAHGRETQPPPMGDQRTFTADGLRSLMADEFKRVEIEEVVVSREVPRSGLWNFLLHSVYGLDHLNRDAAEAALERLALPPVFSWRVPLCFAAARAPGGHY
jgi:SAM-dependent methyltransferase